MPHVFQGHKKDGTPYPRWRFQYTDASGVRRTAAGYTARRDTEKLAQRVQAEQDAIRKGYRPAPRSSDAMRSFAEISGEYQAWGTAQGGRGGRPWSTCHARKRHADLSFWQQALGLETVADLSGCLPRVEKALRELQQRGRTGKTVMNRAETLAAFCDWCILRGYLAEDPLKGLGQFDITPRETRRAMTREEIQRLLEVASDEHRLLYETAFCTGLRANELRQLTAQHLDPEMGGLRLHAAWTKNRKEGFQPLPQPLLNRLLAVAERKAAGEPLLNVPSHPARELDKDLTTAGIPKRTAEGKLDFHACRVAYTTFVIEVGATVKEAQTLLRHSTPQLTMGAYARARDERLAEVAERVGALILAPSGQRGDVPGASERGSGIPQKNLSPCFHKGLEELELVEAGGIEPNPQVNKGVTTTGQLRSSTGQVESHAGQRPEVESSEPLGDGANTGQTGASTGEKCDVPGASVQHEDLTFVVAAWPRLPPTLKAAILAIATSVGEPPIAPSQTTVRNTITS